jgi:hypothetical protein
MVVLVSNVTMGIFISVLLVGTTALVNNVAVYFLVADVPVVAMITPAGEKRFARRI